MSKRGTNLAPYIPLQDYFSIFYRDRGGFEIGRGGGHRLMTRYWGDTRHFLTNCL